MNQKAILHTDGGARGNPGPAGVGVVIKYGGQSKKYKQFLGETTNNQAEYQALILGLQKAKALGIKEIQCFLDSELLVNQLNLKFKVKDKELAPLFVKVWNLQQDFKKVTFHYIPREKNKEADKLVNLAIDEATSYPCL